MGQQHEASTLGMWFFVAQEILFFGGLFAAYFVYREMYHDAWKAGSHHQNWQIGAANTVVLIGSSLTMALAVWGAQGAKRKFTTLMLVLTLILGGIFVLIAPRPRRTLPMISFRLMPALTANWRSPIVKVMVLWSPVRITLCETGPPKRPATS